MSNNWFSVWSNGFEFLSRFNKHAGRVSVNGASAGRGHPHRLSVAVPVLIVAASAALGAHHAQVATLAILTTGTTLLTMPRCCLGTPRKLVLVPCHAVPHHHVMLHQHRTHAHRPCTWPRCWPGSLLLCPSMCSHMHAHCTSGPYCSARCHIRLHHSGVAVRQAHSRAPPARHDCR